MIALFMKISRPDICISERDCCFWLCCCSKTGIGCGRRISPGYKALAGRERRAVSGGHKYYDMDQVIAAARRASEGGNI